MAVWQEAASAGTPRSRFTLSMSSTLIAFTSNPLACMCSTHLEQQPQVADLYTVICGLAVWAAIHTEPAHDRIAARARVARERRVTVVVMRAFMDFTVH